MPWNSANIIGLLVGFCLLTLVLVANQIFQRERAALAPRLIRSRVVYAIDGMSAAASGVRNLPFIVLS
ncbi:hypothetical protein N7491_003974, partial [Penicillium cf. griseofulvum]